MMIAGAILSAARAPRRAKGTALCAWSSVNVDGFRLADHGMEQIEIRRQVIGIRGLRRREHNRAAQRVNRWRDARCPPFRAGRAADARDATPSHDRTRTRREGDSCRCLPVDIPGRDPRFDARDWYTTTSPSSDSAGLRLAALAACPFDVTLTSVVVRAVTSKMYTSQSLFLSPGRGRRAIRTPRTARPHSGRGGAGAILCAATLPLTSTVTSWRTSRRTRRRRCSYLRAPACGRDESHDCTVAAHTRRVTGPTHGVRRGCPH